MKENFSRYITSVNKVNKKKKRWKKVVSILVVIAVFCTTYALILPAITLENETVCGFEEHAHAGTCYTMVPTLTCTPEDVVHKHTAECYDAEKNLVCGKSEHILHTHDSSCYNKEGELICIFEEAVLHVHTDSCYQKTEVVVDEGHAHTDACYTEGVLTCPEEEREPVTELKEEKQICGFPELTQHLHSDSCYTTDENGEKRLSCHEPVLETHKHTEECYTKSVKTLVCTVTEHTHVDTCYRKCPICDEVDGHDISCQYYEGEIPSNITDSFTGFSMPLQNESTGEFNPSGELVKNKWITSTGEDSSMITLEAYATGTTQTRPADIVIVVDQSASMVYGDTPGFTPYPGKNTVATDGLTREYMNTEEAKKHGEFGLYYLAYGMNTLCFMCYRNNQWMYYDTYLDKTGADHTPWNTGLTSGSWNGLLWQIIPNWNEIENNLQPMTETTWANFQRYGIYPTRMGPVYEALKQFINDISDDGINHRVSIVGFGGRDEVGTELFLGSTNIQRSSITTSHYQQAFKSVLTEKQSIMNSIDELLPTMCWTHHDGGIQIANNVFSNNPIDLTKRDRILVFFSDGEGSTGSNDLLSYQQAYTAKQTHSAYFYSIGISKAPPTLMTRMSSNYPTFNGSNTAVEEESKYYFYARNYDDLHNAFSAIYNTVGGTSVTLNETSYLKDVVTKYFYIPDVASAIRAFTVNCTGYSDGEPQWSTTRTQLPQSCITVNGNIVEVNGFDYADNYVSEGGRLEGTTNTAGTFHGRKLVVEIDIIPKEEFIGGNKVETNTGESGIYKSTGEAVDIFPIPETDVTITPQVVVAPPLNFYLGDEFLEHVTIPDMQNYMEVYINDVKLDLTDTDNYGFEWENDYVDIDVIFLDENDNEMPNGFTDVRHDQVYKVKVVVSPLYEGAEQTEMTSNEGLIKVFYPEFTFKDANYYFGEPVPINSVLKENSFLENETRWRDADGTYSDSEGISMDSQTVPEISMTLTPKVSGTTLPSTDVPVEAQISSVGYATNTHSLCYFDWNPCFPECEQNIEFHHSSVDSPEFYLHMMAEVIEFPETGGKGTEVFIFSGFALMFGAVLLLYKKRNRIMRQGEE